MSATRRAASVLLAAALVVPALGACGVDTQTKPEQIPSGGLPADLRSHPETAPGQR